MVVFEGRSKHVIKHGGYSVYALEVEQTLERHPDVLEASVVGLPDERLGEVPVAVVRLAEGATLTKARLGAWATEHLAEYKVPKRFVAVDELPRTGTAKVQKTELLDLFATERRIPDEVRQPRGSGTFDPGAPGRVGAGLAVPHRGGATWMSTAQQRCGPPRP